MFYHKEVGRRDGQGAGERIEPHCVYGGNHFEGKTKAHALTNQDPKSIVDRGVFWVRVPVCVVLFSSSNSGAKVPNMACASECVCPIQSWWRVEKQKKEEKQNKKIS